MTEIKHVNVMILANLYAFIAWGPSRGGPGGKNKMQPTIPENLDNQRIRGGTRGGQGL